MKQYWVNIILVIESVRQCFRSNFTDVDGFNLMMYYIKKMDYDLDVLPIPRTEPLVFLKHNRDNIIKTLKKNNDVHLAIGDILQYVGPNWLESLYNAFINSYFACNGKNESFCLYSFKLPKLDCTQEIKLLIKLY